MCTNFSYLIHMFYVSLTESARNEEIFVGAQREYLRSMYNPHDGQTNHQAITDEGYTFLLWDKLPIILLLSAIVPMTFDH